MPSGDPIQSNPIQSNPLRSNPLQSILGRSLPLNTLPAQKKGDDETRLVRPGKGAEQIRVFISQNKIACFNQEESVHDERTAKGLTAALNLFTLKVYYCLARRPVAGKKRA